MNLRPPHDTHSRNHWYWRPGWGPGTRCWTVHAVFSAQPGREQLYEAVGALESLRRLSGWDAIPYQWLHLTMQGVEFADQISSEQVTQLVHATKGELTGTGALTLLMGPALVDAEAINLPVAAPALDGVRQGVRRAMAQVLGADRVGESTAWRPHVSVAYANTTGLDLAPVRAQLDTQAVSARVKIDHVSLIRLHRDAGMYEWDEEFRLPLS